MKTKRWRKRDDKPEQLIGTSCGTVTPGMNNQCCQSKEYDLWNSTSEECEFETKTQ